ncbi:hypothetical protein ZHAS_00017331 [Anopheles sinensis]|uniref:Uncharacterized protein n=1 Tax=Anopheles sinensis TaxID=74873 RepID=A0A084WG29_ANOSI|nr:hypothetical protein ZHAS_00017331 [Anopheles sinensis]
MPLNPSFQHIPIAMDYLRAGGKLSQTIQRFGYCFILVHGPIRQQFTWAHPMMSADDASLMFSRSQIIYTVHLGRWERPIIGLPPFFQRFSPSINVCALITIA